MSQSLSHLHDPNDRSVDLILTVLKQAEAEEEEEEEEKEDEESLWVKEREERLWAKERRGRGRDFGLRKGRDNGQRRGGARDCGQRRGVKGEEIVGRGKEMRLWVEEKRRDYG